MRLEFMKAYDAALEQDYGNTVRMSDFVAIHGQRKVLADQQYTLERAEKRRRQGKRPEADLLETIFIDGVNVGGWLGDVTGDDNAYKIQAQPTAWYDDFSHRLDVAVELTLRKPVHSHDGHYTLKHVTIGVDTTLGGDPTFIREKLTWHYNDSVRLPFGFSHLDYYAHGQRRDVRAMLPRYVIGLNVHEVRAIWDEVRLGDGFRPDSAISLQTRFKVLAEIRRQNLLYFAMLPEGHIGKTTRMAALQIEAVDECLNAALRDCTRQIVSQQVLPQEIFAATQPGSGGRRLTERDAVEKFLIKDNRNRYFNIDPFTQIIGESRRLLKALYAPLENNALRRALEERRAVMEHNRPLSGRPPRT